MTYGNETDPNENEPAVTPANDPIEETGAYPAPQAGNYGNYPVEEFTPEYAQEVEEVKAENVEEIGGRKVYVEEYAYNPYLYNNQAQFQSTPTPAPAQYQPAFAPAQPKSNQRM